MAAIDAERWQRLSPLLDELLDQPAPQRQQQLDALRQRGDAELADELATLMLQDDALAARGFLDPPTSARFGPQAGQQVGAYRLVRELGTGGMGSVWLAERDDGRFHAEAAIKFLRAGFAAPAEAERFAREGRLLARLAHPHIARLLDAGVTSATVPGEAPRPYLVLERVDGAPIDQYVQQHALPVRERVRLLLDVLDAVGHAHNRLILHRDLKPSNILVSAQGEVKLLDFGIGKLLHADSPDHPDGAADAAVTALTQRAGQAFTPQYAAPEQWHGDEVTTATDVYALGVLAYQVLGGGHPTAPAQASTTELMRSTVETEPARLSDAVRRHGAPPGMPAAPLRGDLDTIVAKALKKAPAERYANAGAMADDFRRWLADEPIAARPDSLAYRSAKFVRRNRLAVAAATLTVAGLAVGLGAALVQAREAARRQADAEGLIEFMLGDLRGKLQPVGRLDVLDAVGAKALAHYAAQPAASLDAAAQGRQARALHLLGEIAEQRGQPDEAARLFEQAAQGTERLLARAPQEASRVFDHGQSLYWLGYIARRRGDLGQAERHFQGYRELAERLVTLEPANPRWQVERAYAVQNLGVLRISQGRPADALPLLETAQAIWSALLPGAPQWSIEQANTLGWITKARQNLGQIDAAIATEHAKLDALARVPGAGSDREAQVLQAYAWSEIGRMQLARGRLAEATQAAQAAVLRIRALVALDPANLDWLASLVSALQVLAEIGAFEPAPGSAAPELAEADALLERLLRSAAPPQKWRLDLRARSLWLHGLHEAARSAAMPDRAGWVADATALLASWPRDAQGSAARAQLVAGLALVLGDELLRRGARDAAERRWRDALRPLESMQARDLPALATLAGLIHWRLGEPAAALERAEHVLASQYRHPLFTRLQAHLGQAASAVSTHRVTTQNRKDPV